MIAPVLAGVLLALFIKLARPKKPRPKVKTNKLKNFKQHLEDIDQTFTEDKNERPRKTK